MKINNHEVLKQALANIRLESMSCSEEVEKLIQKALTETNVDTKEIKKLLLKPYTDTE